jgi:hypothetical protein
MMFDIDWNPIIFSIGTLEIIGFQSMTNII